MGGTEQTETSVSTSLVDTSFGYEPLIDEPVTSGGSSGEWQCEDEDRCPPNPNPG